MPWLRASLVWMLMMLAETGHGMVREVFIAPVIGGQDHKVVGREPGLERREPIVHGFESAGVAFHVVAMPIELVEID